MTTKHNALETLLMLRQGAKLSTEYDVGTMTYVVKYWEKHGAGFSDSARTWDKAMERAEAAAVAYIEKVTGG